MKLGVLMPWGVGGFAAGFRHVQGRWDLGGADGRWWRWDAEGSVMCQRSGHVSVSWRRNIGESGRVLQLGITWLRFVIDVSKSRRLKERQRR